MRDDRMFTTPHAMTRHMDAGSWRSQRKVVFFEH
jgi:hypothetical protein